MYSKTLIFIDDTVNNYNIKVRNIQREYRQIKLKAKQHDRRHYRGKTATEYNKQMRYPLIELEK